MNQSNPFKNDIISQKILDQVGPSRTQIGSSGFGKNRQQSGSRDQPQSKQKSTQEIAIQQLNQLHDKYFGQQNKHSHLMVPSNNSELPNETFSTAFRGRQIGESRDYKPRRPVQKRNSYEVEPPQIITQINGSANMTNNQSGAGSNDVHRLKQSNTSLNVLLGENGASFLSRTKDQGLGMYYGLKRDINVLQGDQAARNQSQGYKSRNATSQASKSHKEHKSAEMPQEAAPPSNKQVFGKQTHFGQASRTQGKLMDFKEMANQRKQAGKGPSGNQKQAHGSIKARRQLPNMEKSLKALQKERASSLNAVKLNNLGRVIERVENNQRERSSPTKKERALINECWSADPSKILQTEPDEQQEHKPKIMLFSGINYGGKPTLYDDFNEFFQKEADLERSDFETDDFSQHLHSSVPSQSIVRDSKEIFQPESYTRNWLMKHGKDEQVYFDQKQIHKIKDFFEQLDTDNKGYVEIEDLEDMLVSLGLTTSRQEIELIAQHVQKKKMRQQAVYQSDTALNQMSEKQFASAITSSVAITKINQLKISFDLFLLILKEAQVRNKRGINGNYLLDKNIFFQRVEVQPKTGNKLPLLQEKTIAEARKASAALLDGCCNSSTITAGLSFVEQYNGNGQSNFFKSLRKSDVYSAQGTTQRTHNNRQSKSFEIQNQSSNGHKNDFLQKNKVVGNQMRSKIKQTLESSMPEAYQSNLSTFNIDSVLPPQSNERIQSTMNKATFIQGREKSLEPAQGEPIQLKKTNGQALYMNSKPKIKQFFQNLSSNSSMINVQEQNLLLQQNQKPEISSCMDKFKQKTKSQQLSHRQKFKKGVVRSHERGQHQVADRYLSQSQVQIPFRLLMSNFRRKMIIDTLQDTTTSQEHKNQILTPYQEYLTKQSQLISDKNNQYYFDYGDEVSANASELDAGFNDLSEIGGTAQQKQNKLESKGTSKAALELERTLKKQMWSIKRRRLLKEGQDVSRKYRSTGSFDRHQNQKLFKEMLIQPDQEAVINEEVSAELSVQESSKYTEVVSKPQSELKVSDGASEKCDSKSYTMISSPKVMIDSQRARAIKLKSPNQFVRVQKAEKNNTVMNEKPVYVFKREMQAGSNYRDQEALDEIETQRTKSMKNLLQKQISQETNQSKAYPKLDQSDIDTKTAKGSRSCGSEDALGNAREFIFEQDIDKKGFQDGDVPRQSQQQSPKIVPEDQELDQQSQITNQSPPPESRNQSQLPQQYSLNCENYLKKQNSNKIKTQSRNKETARALYGSKKTNKDIKQLIRQNSKKMQLKNKEQSDLDCLAQQKTNQNTNMAGSGDQCLASGETKLLIDNGNNQNNESGLAQEMMSGFSKYIDEAIARQLQALSQPKNTKNCTSTLKSQSNVDQLPGSLFWQSSELSKIGMLDIDQQQVQVLGNQENESRAREQKDSQPQKQASEAMGPQQKQTEQVSPMIIQQFFVNINNGHTPSARE